jgi:hypothetical protein
MIGSPHAPRKALGAKTRTIGFPNDLSMVASMLLKAVSLQARWELLTQQFLWSPALESARRHLWFACVGKLWETPHPFRTCAIIPLTALFPFSHSPSSPILLVVALPQL